MFLIPRLMELGWKGTFFFLELGKLEKEFLRKSFNSSCLLWYTNETFLKNVHVILFKRMKTCGDYDISNSKKDIKHHKSSPL